MVCDAPLLPSPGVYGLLASLIPLRYALVAKFSFLGVVCVCVCAGDCERFVYDEILRSRKETIIYFCDLE